MAGPACPKPIRLRPVRLVAALLAVGLVLAIGLALRAGVGEVLGRAALLGPFGLGIVLSRCLERGGRGLRRGARAFVMTLAVLASLLVAVLSV